MSYKRNIWFYLEGDGGAASGGAAGSSAGASTGTGGTPSAGDGKDGAEGKDTDKPEENTKTKTEAKPEKDAPEKQPRKQPAYFQQFAEAKRNSDDYRDLEQYETITDLADALVRAKKDSQGSLKIPGKDSSTEEQVAFLKALGVPDTADEYEVKIESLSVSQKDQKGFEDMLKAQMYRNGLTRQQAKGMGEVFNQIFKVGTEHLNEIKQERVDSFDSRMDKVLQKDYPNKADREAATKEIMNYFRANLARTGLGKNYADSGLIYDPEFVISIANGEKAVSTGTLVKGADGAGAKSSGLFGSNYSADFDARYGRR